MSRCTQTACLLSLVLVSLVSSFAPAAGPQVTLTSDEYAMLKSINAERATAGLRPLEIQAQLTLASRVHASEMLRIGRTEHTIDGAGVGDRVKAQGITWWKGIGEIATHDKTSQEALQSWLNSPEHKSLITRSDFLMIGIGVSATEPDGARYWSCVFVSYDAINSLDGASGTVILPAERPVTPSPAAEVEPTNWKVMVTNSTPVPLKVFKINDSHGLELLATLQNGQTMTQFLLEGTSVVIRRTDTRVKVQSFTVGSTSMSVNVQF